MPKDVQIDRAEETSALQEALLAARRGDGRVVIVAGDAGIGKSPRPVIAVDISDEALGLARALGADHSVKGRDSAVAAVRELSGGGTQVVIDFVGDGDAPRQAIEMLRRGGTYFMVGYGGNLSIPTSTIVANELSIVGNLVGTHSELEELVSLAAAGQVKLTTRAYPLHEINTAVDDLWAGRVVGRAVLVPN